MEREGDIDRETDGRADVFHTSQYLDMYIIIYTVYIYGVTIFVSMVG